MPLLKLQVSVPVSNDIRKQLLPAMSKIVSEGIGKPEKVVMVTIDEGSIMMSGEQAEAAFADIRSIGGLNRDVNSRISKKLCSLLDDLLGISPERVFVNFTDLAASNWGWNGDVLGSAHP